MNVSAFFMKRQMFFFLFQTQHVRTFCNLNHGVKLDYTG
jgi:hypothetical protein